MLIKFLVFKAYLPLIIQEAPADDDDDDDVDLFGEETEEEKKAAEEREAAKKASGKKKESKILLFWVISALVCGVVQIFLSENIILLKLKRGILCPFAIKR